MDKEVTQRARTRIQRLKNEEALSRLVSHDIWPKVRKRIHWDCVTVKIGSRVTTPAGGEERRETTILCRRCRAPSIEMNHRWTIPIDTRDLDHLMSGILEEFPRGYIAQFGLGESSVDRYSRIRIVFSPFEEVFETMGTKIQWGLNRN